MSCHVIVSRVICRLPNRQGPSSHPWAPARLPQVQGFGVVCCVIGRIPLRGESHAVILLPGPPQRPWNPDKANKQFTCRKGDETQGQGCHTTTCVRDDADSIRNDASKGCELYKGHERGGLSYGRSSPFGRSRTHHGHVAAQEFFSPMVAIWGRFGGVLISPPPLPGGIQSAWPKRAFMVPDREDRTSRILTARETYRGPKKRLHIHVGNSSRPIQVIDDREKRGHPQEWRRSIANDSSAIWWSILPLGTTGQYAAPGETRADMSHASAHTLAVVTWMPAEAKSHKCNLEDARGQPPTCCNLLGSSTPCPRICWCLVSTILQFPVVLVSDFSSPDLSFSFRKLPGIAKANNLEHSRRGSFRDDAAGTACNGKTRDPDSWNLAGKFLCA
ncbi:uncharacterized protein BCR38DRAFT_471989 [Pseudomassariella vexata]|uniref:Uncharacterized protein n=1 Tax=Pseudomassariella vexata TaxID=1141098 RepID=A0A1Y2EA50_9PEZI|nr:uncharacterized protein BCR38DRAFT_471989 [Pseudomassariella vexata]ORY68422.1 hypothetical protein BCR38DRAFT_471989 [Pseudomassariella vexata]